MEQLKKDYFDLNEGVMVDTILSIKYHNKWWCYNIPRVMSNGNIRTYGQLYFFYTQKEGFRMAKGYIRAEEGDTWYFSHQYFFFDKNTLPIFEKRVLKNNFYVPKNFIKRRI